MATHDMTQAVSSDQASSPSPLPEEQLPAGGVVPGRVVWRLPAQVDNYDMLIWQEGMVYIQKYVM